MKVVIVESPNKVEKIKSFLGEWYEVIPTFGHVCDLDDASISVNEQTFEGEYQLTKTGQKVVSQIKKFMRDGATIFLATDPDREGESIAYHVAKYCGMKFSEVKRIVFYEITEKAIKEAIKNPRTLDLNLVRAQEARRVMDRLIGYQVSPKLSNMLGMSLSAGRVQTAILKKIVEREKAISEFVSEEHYRAKLIMDDWEIEWDVRKHLPENEVINKNLDLAIAAINLNSVFVEHVKKEDDLVRPPAPLITAKVIKLCSMFYDMDPEETMKIMESLMVKGLITYHRTDSYNLSDEAVESIREYLQDHGLPIPPYPTKHKRKKGISQEAHEAIRPTDIYNDSPEELSEDELKVYSLIHRQTLASQMADAHRKITRANFVGDNGFKFVVRGVEYISLSFLELLPELANDHKPKFVPDLYEGECLYPTGKKTIAARTEQPKRYSIATMVEDMDTEGIGRPSTYATVFSSLIKREYIVKEKTILRPTKLGMTVCYSLVDTHFSNSEYTARTEEKFDFLSSGEMSYSDVIKPIASEILDDVKRVSVDMKNVHISIKTCSKCGKIMKKRKGKNGFFWGCTGFPDCKNAESI